MYTHFNAPDIVTTSDEKSDFEINVSYKFRRYILRSIHWSLALLAYNNPTVECIFTQHVTGRTSQETDNISPKYPFKQRMLLLYQPLNSRTPPNPSSEYRFDISQPT